MSKAINHDKFFEIFSKKYRFDKMDKLKPFLKKTVSIIREVKSDNEISIGASKFGGNPDLPIGKGYPFYSEEVPLSFIMQINCKEVSTYDTDGLLPRDGMLYFFHLFIDEEVTLPYDFEEEGLESYLKGIQVFYHDGDETTLERVERPKNDHIEDIKSAAVQFVANYTIPKPSEHEEMYLAAGFTENEIDYDGGALSDLESALPRLAYESEDEVLDGELDSFYHKPLHQLLGSPTFYQGIPDAASDIKSIFGVDVGKSDDWMLLLQIEVDEDLNLYWAADGFMYYSIKIEVLKNQTFETVYAEMQCG